MAVVLEAFVPGRGLHGRVVSRASWTPTSGECRECAARVLNLGLCSDEEGRAIQIFFRS